MPASPWKPTSGHSATASSIDDWVHEFCEHVVDGKLAKGEFMIHADMLWDDGLREEVFVALRGEVWAPVAVRVPEDDYELIELQTVKPEEEEEGIASSSM